MKAMLSPKITTTVQYLPAPIVVSWYQVAYIESGHFSVYLQGAGTTVLDLFHPVKYNQMLIARFVMKKISLCCEGTITTSLHSHTV